MMNKGQLHRLREKVDSAEVVQKSTESENFDFILMIEEQRVKNKQGGRDDLRFLRV